MGNTLPDGLKWAFPLWGILYPMGLSGLEPPTSRLSGVRSNQLSYRPIYGGDEEIRTPDPLLARQVLSQLSYTPIYIEIFSQNQTMLECARHMPLPR